MTQSTCFLVFSDRHTHAIIIVLVVPGYADRVGAGAALGAQAFARRGLSDQRAGRHGADVVSLPLLPGVALHELSHALMATVLGVKMANLTLIPQRQPDGHVRLGRCKSSASMWCAQFDRPRAVAGGQLAILLIIRFAFDMNTLGDRRAARRSGGPAWLAGGLLRAPDAWLWLYLLFSIANAMMPSPSDRETWPPVISSACCCCRWRSRLA